MGWSRLVSIETTVQCHSLSLHILVHILQNLL
uniref:Uncharacterized protein n=1 Tax=Anguilla anguilla TaxID=7936 RepID=A0A0E9TXR8_ANGAN